MDLIQNLIRYVKCNGLGNVYTSKKARHLSSEIYHEISSAKDFETCITSHLHDCGLKGKLYRELWDEYISRKALLNERTVEKV